MIQRLRPPVRQVIELLTAGKYLEIEALTNGNRLKAHDIATAIRRYGRRLVAPPDDAFGLMDVVEVRNTRPRQWSVTMPLWTEEEGRSDLSVTLTLTARATDFQIELDDIHVL